MVAPEIDFGQIWTLDDVMLRLSVGYDVGLALLELGCKLTLFCIDLDIHFDKFIV